MMNPASIHIRTIGFTQKSAKEFFEKLRAAGVQRVVDVRLNNASQLAGFSKRADLEYFLQQILGIGYVHLQILAPTQDILDDFKKHHGNWSEYERRFVELMKKREIEKRVDPSIINGGCLLCSEDKPQYCHRRLVAEYLRQQWGAGVRIEHL